MAALNYHHLRLFQAVARDGSIARASQRLNLSASALSVQIRTLEQQLGQPLFDRVGKRLVLTEAGRIALDHADTVFEAGEDLVQTLAGRPRRDRHRLRVGALTTLSRNFQLEYLRPLLERTDVELEIRSGTMRDLLARLEAHTLDLVLANAIPRQETDTDLHSHLVGEQPVSLVGPPAPGAPPLRVPEDLDGLRLVLPGGDSDFRRAFDRQLALAGVRPVIVAEVDDMAMLRLLARESGALALVPPVVVRDELQSGLLVERARLPDVREAFYAIVQDRRFPNPLLGELLGRKVLAAG
jgi:LysR family transcriptional regulator, transcriptional activator of nhaA